MILEILENVNRFEKEKKSTLFVRHLRIYESKEIKSVLSKNI